MGCGFPRGASEGSEREAGTRTCCNPWAICAGTQTAACAVRRRREGMPLARCDGPGNSTNVAALELEQDETFQRRERTAQRIAWWLIAIAILAALLGLFGSGGPFATAVIDGGGAAPLRLELERFAHYRSPGVLRMTTATATGEAEIRVARDFLEAIELEQVTPPPSRVEAAGDELRFVFAVAASPLVVTLHFTFERWGWIRGHVGRPGGSLVAFRQLVYP